MGNTVRQYKAGTPEFSAIQAQFEPLKDSELTENPLFPDYDELLGVPTADAVYNWQQAAHLAFRTVATRQQYFTTDDVYGELLKHGIKNPPDKRVMGVAVLNARNAHIMVDDGGKPVPSVRMESHHRPIRRYRSLIFLEKKLDESLRVNETPPDANAPHAPSRARGVKSQVKKESATEYWKSRGTQK
jgi:hypothetical protein